MKKILLLLMSMTLLLNLAACGTSNDAPQTDAITTAPSSQTPETTNSEEESTTTIPREGDSETHPQTGKVLVVYYSASGNTQRVAEDIAKTLGGNLFELVPTEIYSNSDLNWTDRNSRVSREHDDESLRDVPLVANTVENWDEYDTVFIGYPIWWGIAAWPVDNFVKNNDFSGKTVIPFATSSSSGMGQSGTLLAEMAVTGDWQAGLRFNSGASAETVQDWVKSLGLA